MLSWDLLIAFLTASGLTWLDLDRQFYLPQSVSRRVWGWWCRFIFGNGAVAAGMGRTKVPSELDRDPEKGNGGGQETLYSRRADIIHPLGFEFTSSSVAGQSANLAELALAANWSRVWERKNVPLCFLQTNG